MNENVINLLKERYFLKEEKTWEDIANRVGSIYKPITEYILNLEFIPSSPTLMNANTKGERIGTLSSCFPMGIEDSIEGIYDANKEAAIVTKFGGGVGYDFSSLRGSNETIESLQRASSGPLPFINVFNATLDGIQQGGVRRGAGMAMLAIDHPDIIKFIEAKKNYKTNAFSRFNFSVKIPDWFYEKLEKTPDAKHCIKNKENNYTELDITVKELWDKIVDHAWLSAEPGIFNETIAYDRCTCSNISDTVLANPCFTGDTIVAVADGRNGISIKQLAEECNDGEKYFPVYSSRMKTTVNQHTTDNWKVEVKEATAFKTGYKEVIEIILSDGSSFKCTPEHKLATPDGRWIEAQDSTGIQLAKFYSYSNKNSNKSYRTINSKSNGYNRQYRMIWEFLHGKYEGNIFNIDHKDDNSKNDLIENLQLLTIEEHKEKTKRLGLDNPIHKMDSEYRKWNMKKRNINANATRWNWSEDKKNKAMQEFLLKNPKPEIEDKNIYLDYEIFVEEIIWDHEFQDVYDLTVEDNHNFYIITNTDDDNFLNCSGILVHNCSEFVHIPYSSCNLGSINLSKLVEETVDGPMFNYFKFKELIKKATIFLDNVIDKNKYPIKKIEKITQSVRPIGLGTMGLAHALFKLNIPYDSVDAKLFTEEIFQMLTLISMEQSIELAKEKGSYDAFDLKTFLKANTRFIDAMDENLLKDLKKYGCRNSCQTSIAPTGSIAYLADSSSGIEPVFALTYARKIEKLNKEYEVVYLSDPVFDEYLKANFEEEDQQKILRTIAENNGSCQECKDIPKHIREVFKVAGDLTPKEHLSILAKVANNISLSVSKTINLPKDISREKISEVYKEAHKLGIIGVTVYRDGSREGILVHNSDEIDFISEREAPKRPEDLPCHIYRLMFKGEKWIIFVGLYKGKPYEIFAGKVNLDLVDIPSTITDGIIKRKKQNQYQFILNDEVVIGNITKSFETGAKESITRLISTSLRHGVPVDFIVEQLEKSQGTIADFNKVITRAFKKYLKDGISTTNCPNCGEKLVMKDGCKECPNPECGQSYCG